MESILMYLLRIRSQRQHDWCCVENYSRKSDVTYAYWINLVEAIIKHQTLCLTRREFPMVALSHHVEIRDNY